MKKQLWPLFIATIVLIVGGGLVIREFHDRQKLGAAGVKTRPLAGNPQRLEVVLPEHVLDYDSEEIPTQEIVLNTLPQDTSYGQRSYKRSDGFVISMNVVLMGADRTSLHKPQFCLQGDGWRIDAARTVETTIPIQHPVKYELPIVRMTVAKELSVDGRKVTAHGVFVYWYVTDGALSASTSGFQRLWWMARDMMRTCVLQRWAYVMCFAVCAPGQEEATYARMKEFIAASVPEFQLTPSGGPLAAQK